MIVSAFARPIPENGVIASNLHAAELACQRRGVQFTPMRCAVLEVLWQAGQPLGAYDVIRALEAKLGRRLTPPTVYRALEFLLDQRFVARIESMSAFVPCAHPDHEHACVFFICQTCRSSAEIENAGMEALFKRDAASLGFRIGRQVVELQGTCASCQSAEVATV
ncbi:Fur family transcriptional regulator [Ancylobacter mangrovi]|uniref:Fur family transcriptional regulator n=1 Tax=Ancylobacter mangrovi TaxID=2972472 RepID=UPI0021639F98|nr:Fur family transcriptional regulator [Ancylobacter mangrovi]MCS0504756.1 transcriptional repressor [Ancylobacter mangrovi]